MLNANRTVVIGDTGEVMGTGWLPSVPDLRDYTDQHPKIAAVVSRLGMGNEEVKLPEKTDLCSWCSPVENQGKLGSCTANAAAGVVEYFERKAFNNYVDVSRLFIYKTTRGLMKVTGDTGAYLRDTMGALVLFGAPPEKYWPYTDRSPNFDQEPPAFVYSLADNYETVQYFCHDGPGAPATKQEVLGSIKKYLAAGIPTMFGFYGFPSFDKCDVLGGIPYPGPNEKAEWGHAVVTVGYDDGIHIKNTVYNVETVGALLIRNSWGDGWGDKGYGWLPYDYVLNGIAADFWSIISMKWVDTGLFGL